MFFLHVFYFLCCEFKCCKISLVGESVIPSLIYHCEKFKISKEKNFTGYKMNLKMLNIILYSFLLNLIYIIKLHFEIRNDNPVKFNILNLFIYKLT